ncbi:MAG TPA: hypothetical protein QGF95_16140 [Candidatus Latescibacteria bacterium]|nr:hypothetical protein [Gemmatimonadaceae bacterium]MDP6016692.1 hypothetical protein [Candidatus Latescibacterota bacterium]HJP32075.1 hypothetical protein [Candidatus Latescibacterota bacterium]
MSWPPTADTESTDDRPDSGKRGRFIEDLFILLCVLSLWPVILGWQHMLYEVLLYAALAGLVFVLVRRVRRFSQARNGKD